MAEELLSNVRPMLPATPNPNIAGGKKVVTVLLPWALNTPLIRPDLTMPANTIANPPMNLAKALKPLLTWKSTKLLKSSPNYKRQL